MRAIHLDDIAGDPCSHRDAGDHAFQRVDLVRLHAPAAVGFPTRVAVVSEHQFRANSTDFARRPCRLHVAQIREELKEAWKLF